MILKRKNSVLLICVLFVITFPTCLNFTWENHHIEQGIENPAKTHKLVKFLRGAGATTADYTNISLLKITDPLPNEGGNIFSCERSWVEMEWLSNNEILIRYPDDIDTFLIKREFEGFKIKYDRINVLFNLGITRNQLFDAEKINKIEMHGIWRREEQELNLSDTIDIITDKNEIQKICQVVKSASEVTNVNVKEKYGLSITCYPGAAGLSLIETDEGNLYFKFEQNGIWYDARTLAKLINEYISNNKLKIGH